MIPSPVLQERAKYLRKRALVSLKDFAAKPQRKQVMG